MYVDILILANLVNHPRYGYEIKKQVERELGHAFMLNNGLLYPALHRFVKLGAVERSIESNIGKPDRHIYHLTEQGQVILHDLLCDFSLEVANSGPEFWIRVAFFDLLTPSERLKILDTRRSVLNGTLALLAQFRQTQVAQKPRFYANQVQALREMQVKNELIWIDELLLSNSLHEYKEEKLDE